MEKGGSLVNVNSTGLDTFPVYGVHLDPNMWRLVLMILRRGERQCKHETS